MIIRTKILKTVAIIIIISLAMSYNTTATIINTYLNLKDCNSEQYFLTESKTQYNGAVIQFDLIDFESTGGWFAIQKGLSNASFGYDDLLLFSTNTMNIYNPANPLNHFFDADGVDTGSYSISIATPTENTTFKFEFKADGSLSIYWSAIGQALQLRYTAPAGSFDTIGPGYAGIEAAWGVSNLAIDNFSVKEISGETVFDTNFETTIITSGAGKNINTNINLEYSSVAAIISSQTSGLNAYLNIKDCNTEQYLLTEAQTQSNGAVIQFDLIDFASTGGWFAIQKGLSSPSFGNDDLLLFSTTTMNIYNPANPLNHFFDADGVDTGSYSIPVDVPTKNTTFKFEFKADGSLSVFWSPIGQALQLRYTAPAGSFDTIGPGYAGIEVAWGVSNFAIDNFSVEEISGVRIFATDFETNIITSGTGKNVNTNANYEYLSAYTNMEKFPIGIFNDPTSTYANYNLIKEMNANYVTLGNGPSDYQYNDAAVAQAEANGLKAFVVDQRINWTTSQISQTQTNNGKFFNNSNPLGQTFKIPTGFLFYLSSLTLFMDPANWTAGVTLTATIYDSPSKTTVISTSSLTGPRSSYYHEFPMSGSVAPGATLYWELTSNTSTYIGWVCTDDTNPYANGSSYDNGVESSSTDFWFKLPLTHPMYSNNTKPSDSLIDEIADHYKSNLAVAGYAIKDEPYGNDFSAVFDVVDRFRLKAPNQMGYVNILPDYAGDDGINGPYGFGYSQINTNLTSSNNIGQTFITNKTTTSISTMQFYIDYTLWSSTEGITLKLWDSPSKNILIAQTTKYGGGTTSYPQFTLSATVFPDTAYYIELTHNGGGDNSVGSVVRSSPGIDWERTGTAYASNAQIPDSDFWFTINQNIVAKSYEDYVYRWAKQQPDFLMYDYYPFSTNNGFMGTYYSNLEIIRRQSLSATIPFWSYIQSCGINNSLRAPNANEVRNQVFTNLTYGCKGINYFLYQTPDISSGIFGGIVLPDGTVNTTLYNAVKDINAQVLKLGPTLLGLKSQVVYHSGTLPTGTTKLPTSFFFKPTVSTKPVITGYFTNRAGRKYIMIANRDYVNSTTVTFVLNPKPTTVTEVSKTTGLEVATNYSYSTGRLSTTFSPGEGKLYALPVGY